MTPPRTTPTRSSAAMLTAALFGLLLVGCGGGSSESNVAELPGPSAVALGELVTEQDIGTVRAHYRAGLQRWTAATPSDYTVEVSLDTIELIRVQVVAGEVVSEEVVALSGEPSDIEDWTRPRSIDGVFATVDAQIARFEDDPNLLPERGECGHHLNISFDPVLGYPTYYDSLGPCEDGVGVRVTVIPV